MMIEHSDSIKSIGKALLTFQQKVDTIKRDATNSFFKSSYASLSHIQDEIRLPLIEAGIVYTQHPIGDDVLVTLLIHPESGEWIESAFILKPIKDDPQAKGSCISYQRRYALTAVLGLNVDDDDGNNASGKKATTQKPSLIPQDKAWTKALEYLKEKDGNIEAIEKRYTLSAEHKSQLLKEAK